MGEEVYGVVKEKKLAFYQAQHGEFANPWESPWNKGVMSVSCLVSQV